MYTSERWHGSVGLLLLFLAAFLSCVNSDLDSSKAAKGKREKERQLALAKYPLSDISVELELETVFPSEDSTTNTLQAPFCVSINEDNGLLVSDRVKNEISIFSLQGVPNGTLGRQGNGPGDFSGPLHIAKGPKGLLAIYDSGNNRIQLFQNLHYLFSFKLFNPCFALAVDRNGHVYVSLYKADPQTPLIDTYTGGGRLIAQFGSKLVANTPLFNNVDIAAMDDTLYVAWKTCPRVVGFATDGRLIFEHLIDYGPLKLNGEYNKTVVKTGPAVSFRPVLWKIRPFQAGYRLLLNYPRLTILEINLKGIVTKVYWKDISEGVFISDFMFLDDQQGRRIYAVETGSDPRIAVYRPKEAASSGPDHDSIRRR